MHRYYFHLGKKTPFQIPSSGSLSVDEGSPAVLGCQALGGGGGGVGGPSPLFHWRREGRPFPDTGEYTFEGGEEYEVESVSRKDAGRYFCTAQSDKGKGGYHGQRCCRRVKDDLEPFNKFFMFFLSLGESSTASLHLQVNFPPSVSSASASAVRGGRGLGMELNCVVAGEPRPKVTWYKGEEVSCHVAVGALS